jgi:hypothetical protein
MKYKFEVHAELLDEQLETALAATAEGLEGSSHLVVRADITVNTELPEEKIEMLRQSVSEALSSTLGSTVEAQLVSQEH